MITSIPFMRTIIIISSHYHVHYDAGKDTTVENIEEFSTQFKTSCIFYSKESTLKPPL